MRHMKKNDDLLMTTDQLAERWNLAPITLEAWRRKRKGPAYVVLMKSEHPPVRYKLSTIREYELKLEKNKRKK